MPEINYREREYAALGVAARWLDERRAGNAYAFALQFSSNQRYGLNEETVRDIERMEIGSRSVADGWLKSRLSSSGTVQVVYGRMEVCVLNAADFLANWKNIVCPGRDDAIILHNLDASILFYCHENELEFGQRDEGAVAAK